jgi:hypothetical protein
MASRLVGYEFLRERLRTGAFALARPAAIFPVTKLTPMKDYLQVPASVAPASDEPLSHLLFALKHEGIEMQAAVLALKKMDEREIGAGVMASPSSVYTRQAGYLWELANDKVLEGLPAVQSRYAPLFDPQHYVTGSLVRSPRWRVEFNGIGSPTFCPTVKRTKVLQGLLDRNLLGAAKDFVSKLDASVLDRAVRWAYLSETEGSYEIERETPPPSKAAAFAALLERSHEVATITEESLVALQNLAVSNPIDKAVEFRNRQNRLRGALPGALGITYVPPEPSHLPALMDEIMALANNASTSGVDPIVLGALVSFAFVFAHPFMDGNGRLSRFLFHRVVGASGALPNGVVLPVSVAMKRNEARYLAALQSFSKPAREAWDVLWIDGDNFDLKFNGPPEIYRYWDATPCVEFGLQMAQEALEKDLQGESDFLVRFDRVYKAVNDAIDMNGNDLALLVRSAVENEGKVSNNRMKQLVGKGHLKEQLDLAQQAIDAVYEDPLDEDKTRRA